MSFRRHGEFLAQFPSSLKRVHAPLYFLHLAGALQTEEFEHDMCLHDACIPGDNLSARTETDVDPTRSALRLTSGSFREAACKTTLFGRHLKNVLVSYIPLGWKAKERIELSSNELLKCLVASLMIRFVHSFRLFCFALQSFTSVLSTGLLLYTRMVYTGRSALSVERHPPARSAPSLPLFILLFGTETRFSQTTAAV